MDNHHPILQWRRPRTTFVPTRRAEKHAVHACMPLRNSLQLFLAPQRSVRCCSHSGSNGGSTLGSVPLLPPALTGLHWRSGISGLVAVALAEKQYSLVHDEGRWRRPSSQGYDRPAAPARARPVVWLGWRDDTSLRVLKSFSLRDRQTSRE